MQIYLAKASKAVRIQTAFIFEPRKYPLDRNSLII